VGSAKRGGMRLITVVAGSNSDKDRFSDTQRLLEYGFRFFATQKVISADQQLKEITVWGGLADSLKIGVIKDVSLTLPRTSFKDLKINYKHKNNIQAPIKKGELIGSLEIVSGDEVVYSEDLVALENIDSKGFFGRVWSKFILWVMSLFGLNDNGSN
jgi:D-alanyl-D-alanine carboxypeptidase (penicillin-binding protein 5/6)